MSFLEVFHEHLYRSTDPRPPVSEVTVSGIHRPARPFLAEKVSRARAALADLHVAPGDRVVLLGPNSIDWVALDLAILFEGGISVPLYAKQEVGELVAQMVDSAPRAILIVDPDLAESVRAAWPEAPIVPWSWMFEAQPIVRPVVRRAPNDVVTLVYTSGTTGGSKGAMITVANVDFMLPTTAAALSALREAQPGDDDRVFHYLPLCFMGSRVVLWTCLWRDDGILLGTSLDSLVDEIGVAKPHYFLNVPLVLDRFRRGVEQAIAQRGFVARWLYQRTIAALQRQIHATPTGLDAWILPIGERRILAPIRARFGPNLAFLICGSAQLSTDTQLWFGLLGIPVLQVYGLTETTAIVSLDGPDSAAPDRVGLPISGIEVAFGAQDEILVRGPNVFAGYWDRPEATAEVIRDGWLHTGDEGALDEEGRLVLRGRLKEILVLSTGKNVAPSPIEQRVLQALPALSHAVLIGHARSHLTLLAFGEVSRAQVQAALDAVNPTLSHDHRVRGFYLRPSPLSHEEGLLTANGKVRRKAIDSAFAAEIGALYR